MTVDRAANERARGQGTRKWCIYYKEVCLIKMKNSWDSDDEGSKQVLIEDKKNECDGQ